MPIDPSIALGVKPVELGNPLERYMQLQQIQGAQNQNRLADLMYGEKQQQVARAQSLRTLANSWDANTTDEQVRDSLRNNGFFDEADKYETMLQNRAKTKSEVGKNDAEAQANHIDTLTKVNGLIGSAAGAVVQNPNYDTAVQLVNGLRQQLGPDMSKQLGLDTLEIPRDPVQLKDWAQGHYTASIDTEKQLADARAAFEGNANRKSQQQIAAGHDATTRRGQDLTDARAREQIAAGKVPSGYRLGPNGTLVAIPGGPADQSNKPLTEFQGKSAAFADRAQEADAILTQLQASAPTGMGLVAPDRPGVIKGIAESVPFVGDGLGAAVNALPSALGGPNANQQKAEQAQRNFVNAILRQESGAAIGAGEFENARKQYFPQPGDTPEVIAQKAANRKTAIAGLARSAGGNYTPPAAPTEAGPNKDQSGIKFLGFE